MTRAERLAEFAAVAVTIEKSKDYPPQMLISQWALESAWGTKQSGRNNFFGMTKADRHGESWDWADTREVLTNYGISKLDPEERASITSKTVRPDGKFDVRLRRRFASYPTLLAGVLDKVMLIQEFARYSPAFRRYQLSRDVLRLIEEVAQAGYATDPNYAQSLKAIAVQANVLAAIKKARAAG